MIRLSMTCGCRNPCTRQYTAGQRFLRWYLGVQSKSMRSPRIASTLLVRAGIRENYEKYKAERLQAQQPFEARVLNAILNVSSTPYSSYVPAPRGILHGVHAIVKQVNLLTSPQQAWLVVLLLITARSQAPLLIAGGVVLVTVLALPPRLWKPQLKRLGLLALFLFVSTAVFADGVPPVTQTRNFPAALERVPQLQAANPGYHYVLFHWLFITITRRSVQLAISTACLTFTALQSASLCLTTTPAEQLALGVRAYLQPLGWLGLPVADVSLTLLLSLRFLAVVFEEVRNLALGLAARNIDWRSMGSGAGVQVSLKVLGRLFSNLVYHSENIAVAMKARGFVGPKEHQIVMGSPQQTPALPNVLAVALLGCTIAAYLSAAA